MSWIECPICYAKFKKPSTKRKYCDDCLAHRQDEIEAYRAEQRALKALRQRPAEPLNEEFVAEIEAYNKEHGTNLTYGQYVAMVDGCGKLEKKVPFWYMSIEEMEGGYHDD